MHGVIQITDFKMKHEPGKEIRTAIFNIYNKKIKQNTKVTNVFSSRFMYLIVKLLCCNAESLVFIISRTNVHKWMNHGKIQK